jgi:hypothetical protein
MSTFSEHQSVLSSFKLNAVFDEIFNLLYNNFKKESSSVQKSSHALTIPRILI